MSFKEFVSSTEELFAAITVAASKDDDAEDNHANADCSLSTHLFRLESDFCFVNDVVRQALDHPKCHEIVQSSAESQISTIAQILCTYPCSPSPSSRRRRLTISYIDRWAQVDCPEVAKNYEAETIARAPAYSCGPPCFEGAGLEESLDICVANYVGMSSYFIGVSGE